MNDYKKHTSNQMSFVTAKVKEIIEDDFIRGPVPGHAARLGVIRGIWSKFSPQMLHNFAIAGGKETDDGGQNMEAGAKEIYRRSMKNLKEYGVIRLNDVDWIVRKKVPLEKSCGWIKTSSKLPEHCGSYIIYAPSADPQIPMLCSCWFDPRSGWGVVDYWKDEITHWQPLPQPPKGAA